MEGLYKGYVGVCRDYVGVIGLCRRMQGTTKKCTVLGRGEHDARTAMKALC